MIRTFLITVLFALTTSHAMAADLYHTFGSIKGVSSVIQTDDFNFIVMQDHRVKEDVIGAILESQCKEAGSKVKFTPVGKEVKIPWHGNIVPLKIKSQFECGSAFTGALFDIVKPESINPGAFIRTVQPHPVDPQSQVTVQGVPWLRD